MSDSSQEEKLLLFGFCIMYSIENKLDSSHYFVHDEVLQCMHAIENLENCSKFYGMPRLPQKYGLCDGDQEVQISETQLGK
jgi:hypothetical protein